MILETALNILRRSGGHEQAEKARLGMYIRGLHGDHPREVNNGTTPEPPFLKPSPELADLMANRAATNTTTADPAV